MSIYVYTYIRIYLYMNTYDVICTHYSYYYDLIFPTSDLPIHGAFPVQGPPSARPGWWSSTPRVATRAPRRSSWSGPPQGGRWLHALGLWDDYGMIMGLLWD